MRPKAKATAAKANGAGQGGSYVGAGRDSVTGVGRTARWGQAARTEQKGAGGWREGLPWLALLPVLRCSMAHGAPPENLNTPGHTAGDASDLGPIGQGGGAIGQGGGGGAGTAAAAWII